jgi:hypothetical protein
MPQAQIMILLLLFFFVSLEKQYVCIIEHWVNASWMPLIWNAWDQSVLDFFCLILEYLYMHNKNWGWDPRLNMKFTYVSYIPYIHSLKVLSCNTFNNVVHKICVLQLDGLGGSFFPLKLLNKTVFCSCVLNCSLSHEIRHRIFHWWSWWSKCFGFWSILNFCIRDTYPMFILKSNLW